LLPLRLANKNGRISMRPFFCPRELKKSARSLYGRATMPATEISQNVNITAAFFHSDND
jgi:hypothetical protein